MIALILWAARWFANSRAWHRARGTLKAMMTRTSLPQALHFSTGPCYCAVTVKHTVFVQITGATPFQAFHPLPGPFVADPNNWA
jgi:hypothetical protein